MSTLFNLAAGRLRGHAPPTVQMSRPAAPASLRPQIVATQRRYRHKPKPYSCPARLRAPLNSYKAVRANKLRGEIGRIPKTRFSRVTVKPMAPDRRELLAHLKKLKATKVSSKALHFFKKGLGKRALSLLGWSPLDCRGSLLFIDLANANGALNVRRKSESIKSIRFVWHDLEQLARRRECQVFVMVEGQQRTIEVPSGIQVIRAKNIKRKNIGDDALVRGVLSTLEEGIEADRIVLITEDKGLIARMPSGVRWRSPRWLAGEIVNVLLEPTLADLSVPAVEAESDEAVGSANSTVEKETMLNRRSWWRKWWESLRSFPTLFWSSIGPGQSHHRDEVARTSAFERS